MVEHLLIASLFVFVIPAYSVYSFSEVNEISKEYDTDQDVLNFILDTVSVTVLVLLAIVLIAIGVLIFFLCQCSPKSNATSIDDNEYEYRVTKTKDIIIDINANQKERKYRSNARTARKLSLILECQLDPISMV